MSWVETKDGKIFDVYAVTDNLFIGREVIMTEPKLIYGIETTLSPEEIVDPKGIEDDLATIFDRMDEEIEEFMNQIDFKRETV